MSNNFHTCHSLAVGVCLKEMKSFKKGLTQTEAEKRLKKNGPNKLEEKKPISRWVIFFSQFRSPLIYILIVAGIFSLILREYAEASVIFGAVILNTIIGFFQENKANNSLAKLREMIEHKAFALRDGNEIEIDSSQVVVGDVICIEAGNKIPADARLIESANLKVGESVLTGESIPSSKTTRKVAKGAPLADRESMVYAGTVALSGRGKAVVTACGKDTEIGKISTLVSSTKEEKTPLQVRLASFSKFLGITVVIVCLMVLAIGIVQGREFFEMFLVSVSLAVAAIPEGLIVSVTFILVLGMQRILKEKALTRKLVATETLGTTTVICSDKTGTLTEGKMSVSNIIIGEKEFEVSSLGSRQEGKEARIVSLAMQIGMMCNGTAVENPDEPLKEQRFIGEPTDIALFSVARQAGLNKVKLLELEPQIDEIPFSSDIKFMATLHKWRKNKLILYEKGAPEILLDKSSKFYHEGSSVKMSINNRVKLDKNYESLTKKGLRVIGVAIKEMNNQDWKPGESDLKEIDNGLTFVGFIALKDPLRPDAKETIREAKAAGIRPVIITGDHKLTAMAVGKEVGLKTSAGQVVTGEVLDKMDDEELRKEVSKINIYARVSPHHKLRIIKALQARGEVVAMTGDGINDSPALKAADIGISLGTGTDIAKETSDMVLLDNNFSVIVSAIKQGRTMFYNIRKVITYLIADSFTEVILVAGSIIMGMPLALLPAQILWINIVNDGLPHFSLAFEKSIGDIMKEKPIKKGESIISNEMKAIIFGTGIFINFILFGLFIYMFRIGVETSYLRTIFFAIIGTKSLVTIFSLRSFSRPIWRLNPFRNWYLIGAVMVSFGLLLSAIYWGPMQSIMSTVFLDLKSWGLVFATALISLVLIEITKLYFIIKERKI